MTLKHFRRADARPYPWMLMAASLLSAGLMTSTAWGVTETTPAAGTANGDRYDLTLKELGKNYTMTLRGLEATDSVNFDVRADEVVTGAKVTLQYSYSPALLSELSQLNVMVNDEVAATLPLPKENAGTLQKTTVDIPAHLITEFNRLGLQFIGHYSMSCEDPMHSSLWAKISNESRLSLSVSKIDLPDDLSSLPLPFFDRRDARVLNMPFVFAGAPDNATLEAAGTVASWLGALASYRGARFTANLGQIPQQGNAIVFISRADGSQIPGLQVPMADGPSLSMVANPNDPFGKLLVVSGSDSQALKRAAAALTLGGQALTGSHVEIDQMDTLVPRKPYDAPNWLPTDRLIKLGELVGPKVLNVSGINPGAITVPMRLPPDLFNWLEDGAKLNLKYRYTPPPSVSGSSLMVSFNDSFMKSVSLPSVAQLGGGSSLLAMLKKDPSLAQETNVLLPLTSVALQSRLQLRFVYDYTKQGECRDIILDNMRGMIDPESTLDLRHYEHFMAMPNLGVFKDGGFPFTRMADLSESAVILPDNAGTTELAAYLTVMGRFGESTGYPATAVTVAQADQISELADKDLLVLASGANQPLLEQWASYLPASVEGDRQRFDLSDLPLRIRDWISPDPIANRRQARSTFTFKGASSSTYLTGFESPLKSGRSVVLIASARPEGLIEATDALIGGEDYTQALQGSLVVIQGKHIKSLVADEQYFVGHLGPFKYVQWMLSQHVFLLVLITALCIPLVSVLAYLSLRARARHRLADDVDVGKH